MADAYISESPHATVPHVICKLVPRDGSEKWQKQIFLSLLMQPGQMSYANLFHETAQKNGRSKYS